MPQPQAQPGRPVHQDAIQCNPQKMASLVFGHYLRAGKQLTQQQQNAIELLLQGASDTQVAEKLAVDRSTIFRWRKSDLFAAELDFHRRALREHPTARLQALLDPALDILQAQLTANDPRTQLRAAITLVRMATPG